MRKIAGAFQTLRDSAGFGPDVTSYTIRHTIGTELMARGVPELEIAAIMGHRMPNSRTTGRYLHVAPERFASARKALEDIGNEIGREATRPISIVSVRANRVPVTYQLEGNPADKPLFTGAAVGTALQPSLSRL